MTVTKEPISAYWFARDGGATGDVLPHGDGRAIELGKRYSVRGKLVICENGFHGSRSPFDALQYAPGPILYRTLHSGAVIEEEDKLCSRHRVHVERRDATAILRVFARQQALSVIHLWNAPEVVRQYLETGDESLRSAARSAARAAARSAARAAARDAARAAAGDAAWAAWAAWEAWEAGDAGDAGDAAQKGIFIIYLQDEGQQ